MKRLAVLSLMAVLALCCAPMPASAHVLKTDGDIGAILHIQPDDSPISGTPISYILAFKDTTGRFNLNNCDCTTTLQENGKTVSSQPLKATYDLESEDTVKFPKPGVYVLQVSGKPKKPGDFSPFTLAYTIRVEAGANQAQPFPLTLGIGFGLMIGLIMLAAYAMDRPKPKSKEEQ